MRAVALLIGICATVNALANSSGVSGLTQVGCGGTGCHGNQPSTNAKVFLIGDTIVDPGVYTTYTLRLQHSSAAYGGFNLAAFDLQNKPAGDLRYPTTEDPYIKILNGELTHRTRRRMSGTPPTVNWQVQWRSPDVPGRYVICAVALAADGDGRASPADEWNFLRVTITVRGLTLTAPTAGKAYCPGDTVQLRWTSYGVRQVHIAYSSNGGQTWNLVATVNSTDGENAYSYVVPANATQGSQHRFRVTNADNELLYSESQNLTFNAATTITSQPARALWWGCEGSSFTISIRATGTNLSYQWFHDGTAISGATAPQLNLTNISSQQRGVYICRVSGACGSAESRPCTVAVTLLPRITAQTSDTTVVEATPLRLTVSATGDSLAYQWFKDGKPINGATDTAFVVPSAMLVDSGTYVVEVRNSCDTLRSAPMRVRVQPKLSVDISQLAQIRLYPQPATAWLTVESPEPFHRIRICDVLGRCIVEEEFSDGTLTYTHTFCSPGGTSMPGGAYVALLHTRSRTYTLPFVLVSP